MLEAKFGDGPLETFITFSKPFKNSAKRFMTRFHFSYMGTLDERFHQKLRNK